MGSHSQHLLGGGSGAAGVAQRIELLGSVGQHGSGAGVGGEGGGKALGLGSRLAQGRQLWRGGVVFSSWV